MPSIYPRSKQYQEELFAIYAVKFPDSFFWLCDFLLELGEEAESFLYAVRLYPLGPIERILTQDFTFQPAAHASPYEAWTGEHYSRDLPEFLSCLRSDYAGFHFGLLYDDPAVGMRGAASFCNSDGGGMTVYSSILDAICDELGTAVEAEAERLFEEFDEADDIIDDDGEVKQWETKFQQFIEANQINCDDGRPEGEPSSTDLSLIPALHLSSDDNQVALALLEQGRSLWYWGNAVLDQQEQIEQAYRLMKQAYGQLNRPILISMLEVYRESRLFMLEQQQN
jgi:hypothetical protein